MDIIRYGNDINVTWSVFGRNGAKYSLTDKISHLWLVGGPRKKEISAYSLQSRNQIVFVIDSTEFHRLGSYKLVMEIREPESEVEEATYELSHVLQIVSETYPMTANKAISGQVDIHIKSILNNVYISTLEGASAYEIAVAHGFEGTEEEWIGGYIASVVCNYPNLIFTKGDGRTVSVDITHSHPEYADAIAALQNIFNNFSIVSNGSYYTITLGDLSIPFYSKDQVDALIKGGGSGDVTPDAPEDAYLHFTKNEFQLDAQGNAITSGGIDIEANIPWEISIETLPDQEEDEHSGSEESTALNVYPKTIILEVGKTEQIKEV